MRIPLTATSVAVLALGLLAAACTTAPATQSTPSTNQTQTVAGVTAVTETTTTVAGVTAGPIPEEDVPTNYLTTQTTTTVAGATAVPSPTPEMMATPVADIASMIRMHLDEMQADMMQMHQQMPAQLTPEAQQQLLTEMGNMMNASTQFMVQMQGVLAEMTPAERDQATAILQRMQIHMGTTMEGIPAMTPMPMMTPSAGMMPGDMLAQMAQQMDQMHQMMAGSMQQMNAMHTTQMMAGMAMMWNDMSDLMTVAAPAINRMSPAAQQNLLNLVEQMHNSERSMMRIMMPYQTPSPTGAYRSA